MLVPLIILYLVGRGQDENTSRPGPAISILPTLLKDDGTSRGSTDDTAMMVGEFAGAPVGSPPELPAAAMIRQPLLNAAAPAAVYAAWTGVCAPNDIEIATQRFAIAQFIPANTEAVVPPPELVSTLPTNMGALYAIP